MTSKFEQIFQGLVEEQDLQHLNKQLVTVPLSLNISAVMKIEEAAEGKIKELLETEINQNTDAFIEMMGYDNW
jgi:hypothetical protein